MTDNNEIKAIRCIQCREEFGSDYITEGDYTSCPKCGTDSIPCYAEDDFFLFINTHELRLLTIWSESFVNMMKSKKEKKTCQRTLDAILRELRKQLPRPVALTIQEELESLQDSFPEIEAYGNDGEKILKKKFIN